jgi:hypothetical protein
MTPLGQIDHRTSRSHGCYSLHAVPSRQEQYATSEGTYLASRFGSLVHCHAVVPGSFGVDNRSKFGTLYQFETRVHGTVHFARGSSARGFAVSLRVRQSVALCGVRLSWVQYQERRRRAPSKQSGHLAGAPTKWSETSFPKLLQRFGRRTQLRTSRRCAAAACARPNAISAVSANGLATRSPRSLEKFSSVTA